MKERTSEQTDTVPAPMREAVLYVRVSSKEQEKEGFSIPAQRKLLTEYATQHGLQIVREFEDIETAKRAGRAAFSEMVAFLQENAASRPVLLVEKTALSKNLYRPPPIGDSDRERASIHCWGAGHRLHEDSGLAGVSRLSA